jgi:hypothetical protein
MNPELQPENRTALKEWAVVVRALAQGRQILLFRKGGLLEAQGEFGIEQSEFFLYPTYFHELEARIIPEAAEDLRAVMEEKPPDDRVGLSVYGAVRESVWVSDLDRLRRLRPYHILSPEEVESRFYYRNRPGLFVVLLRIYRVGSPVWLPVTESYAGCRSWVDLERSVSTRGMAPVIHDENYFKLFNELKEIL